MQKFLFPLFIAMLMSMAGFTQSTETFKRGGDRKLSGSNAVKKMSEVSVIQTSVYFQNVTKRSIYVTERNALGAVLGNYAGSKSGGNAASADLIAYLIFSDGEPTDEEYQSIVDEFYTYLNSELNDANMKALEWDKFTGSKYYTGLKGEKEDEKTVDEMRKKGNAWKIYTANQGPRPIRYNPLNHNYNVPAVGGTVKMANYGKEVKANTLLALNVIVDFADIYLEGEASSGTVNRTYSSVEWRKSTVRYSISPQVRATSRNNGGNMVFVFPVASKSFEEIYNAEDIRAPQEFAAQVAQDPAKVQKRSFLANLPSMAQKHEIDPFVVETTKDAYFENVRKALKNYADALVASVENAKK